MTSRNNQCGSSLATTDGHEQLDSLKEFECIQLLQKTAELMTLAQGTEDYAHAVALVRQLGHHTLAILHAGSYIATAPCTMADYLDFLRTNRRRLLDKSRGQGESRYETVYATFEASIEFLEQKKAGEGDEARQDALELLEILSTLHYTSVPLDILVDASEGVKDALETPKEREMFLEYLTAWHVARAPDLVRGEEDGGRLRITEAVARLESLALVRTDRSARAWKSVSMHPLVHGWAGDRRSKWDQKEALRMTECTVALSYFGFRVWRPYHRQFAPHLKRLVDRDKWLVDDAAKSRCVLQACVQIAWLYHRTDFHRDMYEFTDRIMQRLGLHDQEPTEELRGLYSVFAAATDREGSRPAQALRAWETIARLDETTRAENDRGRLINLCDLGRARLKKGQTKEAVALLRKGVKAQLGLGEEHEDLLYAQHDLAMALSEDGQSKEAITLLENVVKIRQRTLPEDSPDRLASQQELAVAYYLEDGQIAEATLRLEEVVRTKAQTFGEEHPSTARTQVWLADAYKRAGRLADAIALYERVVNTRTLALGEGHPHLLTSQHKLASAYLDAERASEAINILQRVVDICKSTLKETDRERLDSQHELARAYLEDGRVAEATDMLERVVEIRKSRLDQENPGLLASQHVLAQAYMESGRVSESIDILERVVEIEKVILDEKDSNRLASQHLFSKAYLESGRVAEAISILERVVEVESLLYEPGHPDRVISQELLDEAYATRDGHFSDPESFSASVNSQPDPGTPPTEADTTGEIINGQVDGAEGPRSVEKLKGKLSTRLVLSDGSGLARSLRARIPSVLSNVSTPRSRNGRR